VRWLPALVVLLLGAGFAPARPSAKPSATPSPTHAHLTPPRLLSPRAEPETADVRIAVISDLNSSYGSTRYLPAVTQATRALLDHVRPELVLITGDMVAGQRRGLRYAAMWSAFHELVTTPLTEAGVLVAPTPGNHDASPFAAFEPERSEYVRQWSVRERTPDVVFRDRSHYPLRYSFTYRGAWFMGLDAARSGPLEPSQRDWVRTELERARDFGVKIVFGHLPLYPTADQRVREVVSDPELETLLREHRVTAYVSGHHHAYYPGAVGSLRHVSMPCLGAGARPLIGSHQPSAQALVVLDVRNGELASVEALRAPEFRATVARSELPEAVGRGGRSMRRDDLGGFGSSPIAFRDTRP
jgi:acid phosphatase type 7